MHHANQNRQWCFQLLCLIIWCMKSRHRATTRTSVKHTCSKDLEKNRRNIIPQWKQQFHQLWKWQLWAGITGRTGHWSAIQYAIIHFTKIWLCVGFVLRSFCRRSIPYQVSVSEPTSELQLQCRAEKSIKGWTLKNLVKATLSRVQENYLILPLLFVCHFASCSVVFPETEKSTSDYFFWF